MAPKKPAFYPFHQHPQKQGLTDVFTAICGKKTSGALPNFCILAVYAFKGSDRVRCLAKETTKRPPGLFCCSAGRAFVHRSGANVIITVDSADGLGSKVWVMLRVPTTGVFCAALISAGSMPRFKHFATSFSWRFYQTSIETIHLMRQSAKLPQ